MGKFWKTVISITAICSVATLVYTFHSPEINQTKLFTKQTTAFQEGRTLYMAVGLTKEQNKEEDNVSR